MGGTNETHLPGPDNLRIHENVGEVHIHDDVRGTKFQMPVLKFRVEYARMQGELKQQKPPYTSEVVDANDVMLAGELNGQHVEWSLGRGLKTNGPTTAPVLTGFTELDSFLGAL